MVDWEQWRRLLEQTSDGATQLLSVQATDRPGLGQEWHIDVAWPAAAPPRWTRFVGRALSTHRRTMLPALAQFFRATGIPIAALHALDVEHGLALFAPPEYPGLLEILTQLEHPWERSALALTVARALAHLHALPLPQAEADEGTSYETLVGTGIASLVERARTSHAEDALLRRAADWLEAHTPLTGQLALCLGDLTPDDIRLADLDELHTFYGWERAMIFDPTWDVASLLVGTAHAPLGDTERIQFTNVFLAAYAEHAPNVPNALSTFVTARLMSLLLSRSDAPARLQALWREQLAHALRDHFGP